MGEVENGISKLRRVFFELVTLITLKRYGVVRMGYSHTKALAATGGAIQLTNQGQQPCINNPIFDTE
jgi:hypothetical protein